jgi:hypothetical protein
MKDRGLATALVCGIWTLSCFAQGPERLRISPIDGDGQGVPISLSQPDQQFKAFLSFFPGSGLPGGEQDVTGQVAWHVTCLPVSPCPVASVSTGGVIHAASAGTATVTAISGPNRASTTIFVLAASLQSIAVSPLTPSVPEGVSVQFTATGTYSDATTHDVTTLATWISSKQADIAAINANSGLAQTIGICSGIGAIDTCPTITAAFGGFNSSTTLTVTPPVVATIAVTPPNASILPGNNLQYTGIAVFTDRTTLNVTTNQATWSSSNTSLATIVASTGTAATVQGSAGGVVNINAVFSGKTGTAKLTVPALTSIAITPANQTISPGTTLQFAATGTYSDGRTQILTNVVVWSSDNAVATINPSTGLATGNMTPTLVTANITATLGTVSGTTKLSVGAGQTVTKCQTLGTAGMTYILLNDVSATGTCFVITANNVTLNLNGHSITYATQAASGPRFGIVGIGCGDSDAQAGFCGGNWINPTIFGPPAAPGADPPSKIVQGAGAVGISDAIRFGSTNPNSQCSGGTIHDLTTFVTHPDVTQTTQRASASIHFHFCIGPLTIFNVTTHNTDAWVQNRTAIEGPDIRLEAWTGANGPTIFNNNFSGGGQGAIFANEIADANIHDNVVGASSHVVQDFAIFAWGSNDQVFNNTVNCQSCRGIFLGGHDFHLPASSGQQVHDNTVTVHMKPQYCPDGQPCPNTSAWGCEAHGSYGIQFDDGPLNASAFNNVVTGFVENGTNGQGQQESCQFIGLKVTTVDVGDNSHNNSFTAQRVGDVTNRAIAFGTESNTAPVGFLSTDDTFSADTYNFFVDFLGADQPQTFIRPVIIKGSNPDPNNTAPNIHPYTTFAFHNGAGSGNCMTQVCSVHWFFVDPTFMGGASKDSHDMKPYTGQNGIAGPAEYFIQWTYTLTVVNASSIARPGLTVTIKDAQSPPNTVFTGTTDANGKISTVLTEFRRANYNPPGFTPSSVVKQMQTPHTVTINGCNPSLAPFGVDVSVPANLTQTKVCN